MSPPSAASASISSPGIASPSATDAFADSLGIVEVRGRLDDRPGRGDPDPRT